MFITILVLVVILFAVFLDQPNEKAPNFTLTTLSGESFSLSNHSRQIVVIDFMATWCDPCKDQMESLQSVHKKMGNNNGNVTLISIDIDPSDSEQDVRNEFGKYVDKWIFAMDNSEENVAGKYKVSGIPKLVIVDKDGYISFSHNGLVSEDKILKEIKKAKG